VKILHLTIDCCEECPYCQYNENYNIGHSSGMDCDHPDAPEDNRIVDEGGYKNDIMRHTIRTQVAQWCPLTDRE